MSDELIEKVARAICKDVWGQSDDWKWWEGEARAAIAVVRAAVIEECARAQVPLPAWVDDDPDDRLAAAAYDFERAFRKAIRSLAKGDEP